MNKFHFNQSLKNIPIPSKSQYQRVLASKIEKFIVNLRWKLFHIQNPSRDNKETYGFKTTNTPPTLKELVPLEEDLLKLAKNIEFRHVNSNFQSNLREQIQRIHETPEIIIKADKSRNLYSLPVDKYEKLLQDNITSEYKKCTNSDNVHIINKKSAKIARSLDLEDRIDVYTEPEAFLTVKDHKPNFPGRVQCRLINPAKANIGKISKKVMEKAIGKVAAETKYNQWRSSSQVISWFEALTDKDKLTFIKFDIISFYPSISQDLFEKALEWANNHSQFSTQEMEILRTARKSLLFFKGNAWTKKNTDGFDITMGSYDGAESCEFAGLYILDKIKDIIQTSHVGLYRDDGLAAVQGSGPQVEAKRKEICQMFQELGLKVTTEANLKETDFLDISFNLENGAYKPYRKDNLPPLYINAESNHPKNIKKNLPHMISDRIASLSSTEEIYNQEIKPYKDALFSAGYCQDLKFKKLEHKKRKRNRKVIWFNPPYSDSVKTNIGGKFLNLIDKHFKETSLEKYFNRKRFPIPACQTLTQLSRVTTRK